MEIPETHRSGAHLRSYHTFTLPANGLRCCVISDPAADKAAASIAVAAGQLHDNVLEGIAHLTEHMLFMGSTTYPAENEYDQYLQQNGGHSNAYTDLEATCFYLDVAAVDSKDDDNTNSNNKFRGALDRLACAVSEPLIRSASLERELQAVDSEHAKNVAQDHWRIHQLSRSLLGTGASAAGQDSDTTTKHHHHPLANFGTGNMESLLQQATAGAAADGTATTTKEEQYERLRANILQFYRQYYVGSNMTLAVLGNQTVQELQSMVEEIFAKVPAADDSNSSSSSVAMTTAIPPLPTTPVQVVQWVPLRRECSQLELQWVIPPQWSLYRSKPSRFWSHLVRTLCRGLECVTTTAPQRMIIDSVFSTPFHPYLFQCLSLLCTIECNTAGTRGPGNVARRPSRPTVGARLDRG